MKQSTLAGLRRSETFWAWLRVTARLWGFLGFVLLVLIIFRHVILPFVIALLLTYVLAPVLGALCRLRVAGRRLPRVVWLAGLYTVLVGLLALFVVAIVPRVATDMRRVVGEAPKLSQKVEGVWLPRIRHWIETSVGEDEAPERGTAPAPSQRIAVQRRSDGTFELDARDLQLEVVRVDGGRWILRAPSPSAAGESSQQGSSGIKRYLRQLTVLPETQLAQSLRLAQRFVVGTLHAISGVILVLMISVFLLLDTERLIGWFRNLVPVDYHQDFDRVVALIDRALSGAIRGQLAICLVNGVLTAIGLLLIGVKYVALLALLAGVMSLIPIFGSILSTLPIVTVALVSGSSGLDLARGLSILAWIIGIHLLEANLLNPKIIGRAAKIHPVVVIFAVVAGQATYGVTGALLAVPIVSAVQAMFVYVRARVRDADATAG